ncbi:MAG TPA: LysR family transcriptional regulator [Acidimicrobiales bacterium]|jgi:DNA-binding transcriptional LysR family regulator|nr:LysR family transcriptional regulator [Acidimicrobiales bacterium]
MDLRQLAALVAVADHGTFSAAADALATVQSNVSTHIRRLERELGATLVDRHASRLTQEGEAVVERARRIQAELDALVADVAAMQHDVVGRVRAGIIGTTARWLVPPLLEAMADRHPHVELEIVDATSTSLEPQLASGRLDLAVVNLPLPSPDLVTERLFDEDLLLFVPADHPLAGREEVRLAEITDIPLFLPPRGTAFRELIDEAATVEGVALRARAELDGIRLIASMAIAGQGAAIVPATAIPADLRQRTKPLAVKALPRRDVGVALRRRALPGAPARAFLDVLRELVLSDDHRPEHVHPC